MLLLLLAVAVAVAVAVAGRAAQAAAEGPPPGSQSAREVAAAGASAPVPGTSPAPALAPGALGPTGGQVGSAEVPIVGGNLASARERALAEALKQVVDQALIGLIPDARASQPKTVVQVLGRARAYVRRYRALEEGERVHGLYGIRIEADIDESALLRAFENKPSGPTGATGTSAASSSGSASSYLLVGTGTLDAVEAAGRAFAVTGARVQTAGPDLSDPTRAVEAAARAGVAAVAFVNGNVTVEGIVRGPGLQAVSCVFSVRVLAAGTGLPVADETESARSFGERVDGARATCFGRAAAVVIPRIVPVTAARVTPDLRTIVLEAAVFQPAAVPALVKQVRSIGSVSATEVRRIVPGRVELWVRSRMAAAALASALGRDTGGALIFGPAEVTGDLVRVTVSMREMVVPAPPGVPAAPGIPAAPGPTVPAAATVQP